MMMRFNVVGGGILIPTGKALELLPEGMAPSEAKKALEGYRKTAVQPFCLARNLRRPSRASKSISVTTNQSLCCKM